MTKDDDKLQVPFEGVLYGETSAWITFAGMIIAIVGLIIAFVNGGGVINEIGLLKDLFGGATEASIWTRDSVFSDMPEHYWFLKQRLDGDEISMIGLVVACYGGVVGLWVMFASMFRKKEVLLYKKGFYTILTSIVGIIITLAAVGIIAIR